ncbi:hypothetical protein GOBAR_AA37425 [Gossypium barbadense]|uniref:Uncharacterized protein n=1 Tax=Gossypium barbadense TaxID=3634 RepID=A0A2P5VWV2_GOSBA|nr:hypothetical protein GOBAR_AA37425 [Gossypium barbadense]
MGRRPIPWSNWGHRWPSGGIKLSNTSKVVDMAMKGVKYAQLTNQTIEVELDHSWIIKLRHNDLEVKGQTEF